MTSHLVEWRPVSVKLYALHEKGNKIGRFNTKTEFLRNKIWDNNKTISGIYEADYVDKIKDLTDLNFDVLWLGDVLSLIQNNIISEETYNTHMVSEQKAKLEKQKNSRLLSQQRRAAKIQAEKLRKQQIKDSKLAPEDYEHMFEEPKPHQNLFGVL